MKKIISLLALSVSILSLSCGYTTRSTLDPSIRTIHVGLFKNNISYTTQDHRNLYLPLLEVKVRNAIIDRFLIDGNLKAAEEEADLVLTGQLTSYERDALRYTDNDDVQEYRVRITVSLQLFDNNKQQVVWLEPNFSGEATYFIRGSLATSEDVAVQDATVDLARRIVERTIENW